MNLKKLVLTTFCGLLLLSQPGYCKKAGDTTDYMIPVPIGGVIAYFGLQLPTDTVNGKRIWTWVSKTKRISDNSQASAADKGDFPIDKFPAESKHLAGTDLPDIPDDGVLSEGPLGQPSGVPLPATREIEISSDLKVAANTQSALPPSAPGVQYPKALYFLQPTFIGEVNAVPINEAPPTMQLQKVETWTLPGYHADPQHHVLWHQAKATLSMVKLDADRIAQSGSVTGAIKVSKVNVSPAQSKTHWLIRIR